MLYRKRHRSRLETTRPSKDRNFLPLFRKKRRQILSTCSSKKLSLSWKPASRTAAIKLLEGNDRSSFYSDTSPPYAPSIYTYIYISARDAQVNASNQPEAIPPLTNDALSSNSTVTDVQRARYWRTWPQCKWLISSNGQRNEARVGETPPTTDRAIRLASRPTSFVNDEPLRFETRVYSTSVGKPRFSRRPRWQFSRFAHRTRPNLTSAFPFSHPPLSPGEKVSRMIVSRINLEKIAWNSVSNR